MLFKDNFAIWFLIPLSQLCDTQDPIYLVISNTQLEIKLLQSTVTFRERSSSISSLGHILYQSYITFYAASLS